MTAYEIYDCRVTKDELWSGTVIVGIDQTLEEAIANKLGLKELFCTVHGRYEEEKNIVAEQITPASIHISQLTVGELLLCMDCPRETLYATKE